MTSPQEEERQAAAAVFVPFLMATCSQVRGPGGSAHGPCAPCRLLLLLPLCVVDRSCTCLVRPQQELFEVLRAPDADGHYGVPISLTELSAFNHGAAEMVLTAPRQVRTAGSPSLPDVSRKSSS